MASVENSMSVDASSSHHASVPQSTTFSVSSLGDMDVDHGPTNTSTIRHQSSPQHSLHLPQHRSSMASISSCCSVSEGKEEIKVMLTDLQAGLNRVLSSNLSEPLVISREPSVHNSDNATSQPRSWCSLCRGNMAPGNGSIWYSCGDCHMAVVSSSQFLYSFSADREQKCKKCHETRAPGYCFNARAPHNMVLRSSGSPASTGPPYRSAAASASACDPSQPTIHMGVICDACNNTIHGVRHKCLDCRGNPQSPNVFLSDINFCRL